MLYNAPYYFAKKQLIFELLVPSLGRYVSMQHTEYDTRTVGGEEKTNDVLSFLTIFNDLMRNQTFPALSSKIFHLSHSLGGNAYLSSNICLSLDQSCTRHDVFIF